MSIADDMKILTENTIKDQNKKVQDKLYQEQLKEQQKYIEFKLKSQELFKPYLDCIKEYAKKGINSHKFYYNNYEYGNIKIRIVAELARDLGFKTHFGSTTTDHGDSAAPCVTTDYWLEINW